MGKAARACGKDRRALRRFLDGRMSDAAVAAFEQRLDHEPLLREALADEMAARVLVELSGAGEPARPLGRICRRARGMMPAYRGGTLASREVAGFAAHLDGCEGCRTAYAILEETGELPKARRALRETLVPAALATVLLLLAGIAIFQREFAESKYSNAAAARAVASSLPTYALPSARSVFDLDSSEIRTQLWDLIEPGQDLSALDRAFADLCESQGTILDRLRAESPVSDWLAMVGAGSGEVAVRRLVAGACVLVFDPELPDGSRTLFLESLVRNLGPRGSELLLFVLGEFESVPFAQAAARLLRDVDPAAPGREAARLAVILADAVADGRPQVAAAILTALRPTLGTVYFEGLRVLVGGPVLGDWPEGASKPPNFAVLLLRDQERLEPSGVPAIRELLGEVIGDPARPPLARAHALVAGAPDGLPAASVPVALEILAAGGRQVVLALEPWLATQVTPADVPALRGIIESTASSSHAIQAAQRLLGRGAPRSGGN